MCHLIDAWMMIIGVSSEIENVEERVVGREKRVSILCVQRPRNTI